MPFIQQQDEIVDFNYKKRTFLAIFGKFPYKIIHWLILRVFYDEKLGIRVWSRNSFELNYLEPGFSDLDLTVFCDNSENKDAAYKTLKRIENLKRFIPLIGEVNFYLASEIHKYEKHFNFFELARDPQLVAKLSITSKNILIEAIVFILKQLEGDIEMLHKCQEKRIKKWTFIYNLINQNIQEAELSKRIPFDGKKIKETMTCIILHLMKIFDHVEFHKQFSKLNFYFEMRLKKIELYKIPDIFLEDPLLYVLIFDKINGQTIVPKSLDQFHIGIIKEKVDWEISGNNSQKKCEKFSQQQVNHLRSIHSRILTIKVQYQVLSFEDICNYLISETVKI